MIDYILNVTARQKLIHVGHSLGCGTLVILFSQRPEYQEKIERSFFLAPAVTLGSTECLICYLVAYFSNLLEVK